MFVPAKFPNQKFVSLLEEPEIAKAIHPTEDRVDE